MEPIIKALLEEGWAVQLKHAPKETSWEDDVTHGFVKITDAAGKVLCDMPGLQHNKKMPKRNSLLATIMASVGEPQESDTASTVAPSEKATSKEAA